MCPRISQNGAPWTRRQFLHLAGAVSAGAAFGPSWLAAAESDPRPATPERSASRERDPKPVPLMPVGVLLGTFGQGTLEERLEAVKASGLDCVQVSLDCAGLPAMPDEIPLGLVERIRREAAARGLAVAAVQGTFNMSHPDAEHRRTGLRRLRVLAEACGPMGTSKIHLCTGTRDRDNMWRRHADNDSPAAWRDMTACMREATEIARQVGVVLAFEPEVNNVVDSARKARRLLDEVGSPHLKVTIDPANIFHAGELPRMREILDEAFALLGRDIVLAHAKDLDRDGDAGHLPAGHGKLDYDRYLAWLRRGGFTGPLLLHGLSAAQVPGCAAFLRRTLARVAATPAPAAK
jgi:sugar phosphate isomerase/epimerase